MKKILLATLLTTFLGYAVNAEDTYVFKNMLPPANDKYQTQFSGTKIYRFPNEKTIETDEKKNKTRKSRKEKNVNVKDTKNVSPAYSPAVMTSPAPAAAPYPVSSPGHVNSPAPVVKSAPVSTPAPVVTQSAPVQNHIRSEVLPFQPAVDTQPVTQVQQRTMPQQNKPMVQEQTPIKVQKQAPVEVPKQIQQQAPKQNKKINKKQQIQQVQYQPIQGQSQNNPIKLQVIGEMKGNKFYVNEAPYTGIANDKYFVAGVETPMSVAQNQSAAEAFAIIVKNIAKENKGAKAYLLDGSRPEITFKAAGNNVNVVATLAKNAKWSDKQVKLVVDENGRINIYNSANVSLAFNTSKDLNLNVVKWASNLTTLTTGSGNDVIVVAALANGVSRMGSIFAGAGNDIIINNGNLQYAEEGMNGEDGHDILINLGYASDINGGAGDDRIFINSHIGKFKTVNGNEGNDIIVSNVSTLHNANIKGGDGNDTIVANGNLLLVDIFGDEGNDYILLEKNTKAEITEVFGGEGNDTIINRSASYKTLHIRGEAGNDTLVNTGLANKLQGDEGRDTITNYGGVLFIKPNAYQDDDNLEGERENIVNYGNVGHEIEATNANLYNHGYANRLNGNSSGYLSVEGKHANAFDNYNKEKFVNMHSLNANARKKTDEEIMNASYAEPAIFQKTPAKK